MALDPDRLWNFGVSDAARERMAVGCPSDHCNQTLEFMSGWMTCRDCGLLGPESWVGDGS